MFIIVFLFMGFLNHRLRHTGLSFGKACAMNSSITDLIWFVWLSQEYSKPSSHAGTWFFEYGALTVSLLQNIGPLWDLWVYQTAAMKKSK